MSKNIRMSCDADPATDSIEVTMREDGTYITCSEYSPYEDETTHASAQLVRSKAITLAKSILDYYGELDD